MNEWHVNFSGEKKNKKKKKHIPICTKIGKIKNKNSNQNRSPIVIQCRDGSIKKNFNRIYRHVNCGAL